MIKSGIRIFQFKSILFQMLAVFLGILISITLVVSASIGHIYGQNNLVQWVSTSNFTANQAKQNTENLLEKGRLILENYALTNYIGKILYDDAEDSARIDAAHALSLFSDGEPAFRSAYLYLLSRDVLLGETPDSRGIAAMCREQIGNGVRSRMCMRGETPFFLIGYPEEAPLVVLALELNTQELFRESISFIQGVDGIGMQLYTNQGEAIFSAAEDLPKGEVRLQPVESDRDYQVYRVNEPAGAYATAQYSEELGVLFLSVIEPTQIQPTWLEILQACILPVLISFLVLTLAYTFFTKRLYGPISSFAASTARTDSDSLLQESRDEVDYLIRSYHQKSVDLLELGSLLEADSQSVLNHLLAPLIRDPEEDKEKLVTAIRRYYPRFLQSSCFLMLALRLQLPENEMVDDMTCAVQRAALKEKAARFWADREGVLGHSITETGQGQTAVLLGGTSAEALLEQCTAFAQSLCQPVLGCKVVTGIGTMAASLSEIHASYAAACEDANRRQYYDGHEEEFRDDTEAQQGLAAHMEEFQRLCGELFVGNTAAEEALLGFSRRIFERCPIARDHILKALKTAGTEALIRHGIGGEPIISRDTEYYARTAGTVDADQLLGEECDSYVRQVVNQIKNAGRIRQYRYVSNAKQYISEHYADSMLSLDSVSQALGISKFYLSSLFKQYAPPGFSEFLRLYRVEQAKELLKQTDYTAAQIGLKTGFASAQSFYSVFKKYVGDTPGNYRQRIRGQL